MTPTDKTAPSQTESISFEFDLHHSPEKVWRALTEPVLLAEWLLPVVELQARAGGRVHVQDAAVPRVGRHRELPILEIEAHRKLSYTWGGGDMDTVRMRARACRDRRP